MGVRALIKRSGEAVLGSPPAVRAGASRMRGRALVLAWHNIVPPGEQPVGEHALHTDLTAFERQLDDLTRFTRVVRLADVIDGRLPSDRPATVITFDDAYHGAVVHGLDAIVRRGLPATVFVTPAMLEGRTFWWDRLAEARGGALDVHERTEALTRWRGDDATIAADRPPDLPAWARATSLDTLRAAAARPGIEVGSHTWSHRNLAVLDAGERRLELVRTVEWLDAEFAGWPRILSLPYGLGLDVADIAADTGHRAILRIDGGWYRPAGAKGGLVTIPRLNISRGLSRNGFRLRLAGFRT